MGIVAHAVRTEIAKITDERDPQGPKRDPMELAREIFSDAGIKKLQAEIAREPKARASRAAPKQTEPAEV
jgi:hypothetical protein